VFLQAAPYPAVLRGRGRLKRQAPSRSTAGRGSN